MRKTHMTLEDTIELIHSELQRKRHLGIAFTKEEQSNCEAFERLYVALHPDQADIDLIP